MAGPNYTITSHNHRPVFIVRSKSCHSNVSRSVGLPKQQRSASGNHETIWATATWASRRYRSGLPVNRRPSTTCYLRSWHSEGPASTPLTTANSGMSSARRQVRFEANSGILYQDRHSIQTRKYNEVKSCNLSTRTNPSKSTHRVVGRDVSSYVYISDGLLCRDLAIRSLRGNPKLLTDQNQPSKGHHNKHRSLPTDLELETILPVLGRQNNVFRRDGIVMVPSKAGYHPRSTSPTYRTLIETKEFLSLELSKKVREMRRDLDGMKARENSAAFNDQPISSNKDDSTLGTNDWYIQMLDTLQDDDDDVLIGELDSEGVDQSNSLPLGVTAPVTGLQFSAECFREHINDSEIIGMNIDDVEQKITERRNKDRNQKKHVFDVQRTGTTPELLPLTKTKSKKMTSNPGTRNLVLPKVGKTKFKVSKSRGKNYPIVNSASQPNLEIIEKNVKEENVKGNTKEPILKPVKEPEAKKYQLQQTSMLTQEINNNTESEFSVEKTPLIPKIADVSFEKKKQLTPNVSEASVEKTSMIPKINKYIKQRSSEERLISTSNSAIRSTVTVPVRTTDVSKISQRLLGSSIKPTVAEVVVTPVIQEEEKKPLTEKEKFLEMRKRMEERKAAQSKRKEHFRDISMLGLSFDNQRERRGKLGNIIASKIDSMLAFGDDDESDDDSSMIASDEDGSLSA